MIKQVVPLETISDEEHFTGGAVFRVLEQTAVLNSARPAYYEYMLVPHPDEETTLMLVNISVETIKAGYILAYVKATRMLHFTTAAEVKRALGTQGVFYCRYTS
jgi:hypothetical protein